MNRTLDFFHPSSTLQSQTYVLNFRFLLYTVKITATQSRKLKSILHLLSYGNHLLVTLQSSSLSPCSSPCWSSSNHTVRLFQKAIDIFDCKSTAELRHSLGGWTGKVYRAVSESVAVATGKYRLALGKIAF